ncbi:MAG: HmuY family protein [Gemmatimonadaceae bacterium]
MALVCVAACSSDSTAPSNNTPTTAELTADASAGYSYVKLGTPSQVVTVSDPSTSSAWDLGFFATNVVVNGGAVGPGGVSAYCVCQNAALANLALKDLTASSQLAAFEGVTATSIPADGSFSSDELLPAINGWYSGTAGSAAAAVPTRTWLLRRGATTSTLGKFRVTSLASASTANAGQVTFEYALQPAAGADFGAVKTATVDLRNGPAYFDLTAGAASTAAGTWDILLNGWTIRSNGGVSGSGSVTALVDNSTPFAQISAAYAGGAPPSVFKKDAYAGVFVTQPWYKYNITGTDNQIWPTYNVYLVKRGTDVFKVQLTGYYGPTGNARQIAVRYAKLR